MKTLLIAVLSSLLAISVFSQTQGVSLRSTNGVAFGTLTVQDHMEATNAISTNTIAGKLQGGTSVATSPRSVAFGLANANRGADSLVIGEFNTNQSVGSLVSGRGNSVQSSAVYSQIGGLSNQVSSRAGLVSGTLNIVEGANTVALGSNIFMNGGIATCNNDFISGVNVNVGDGVTNTFIYNGDPNKSITVNPPWGSAFIVNAPGGIVFTNAPIVAPSGFIGPFYGSNLVGSYVGVSGASPYTVSNLWSVVLPDGATAFQLGNPGAGYASIFATNLIITPDGLHYTLFTDGTNSFFGGDLYLTNSTFHGKSFRPTKVAMTVVGATAQSTNLMELQDGSSNVLASVTASGVFTGNGAGLTNIGVANNLLVSNRLNSDWLFSSGPTLSARQISSGSGLIADSSNPFSLGIEESIIIDPNTKQVDTWFRQAGIQYYFSTNAGRTWTHGNGGVDLTTTSPDLTNVFFPHVFLVGSTYYLAGMKGTNSQGLTAGAAQGGGFLYLWSSTDKTNWTYANSGNPILTNSATTTDWNYHLYNPAIVVITNRWHLLMEGMSDTEVAFRVGYSYSTLAEGPNFNIRISTNGVLPSRRPGLPTEYVGNPTLVYATNRGAIVSLYGDYSHGFWQLAGATAFLTNDLTQAASWTRAPGFGLAKPSIHLADPTIAFGDGSQPWGFILGYNYDQTSVYHTFGAATLDQFYDTITSPKTTDLLHQVSGRVEVDQLNLDHDGSVTLTRSGGTEGAVRITTDTSPGVQNSLDIAGNGQVSKSDANNSSVTEVLKVTHLTTGSSSSGVGAGLGFYSTNTTYTSLPETAKIESVLSDAPNLHSYLTLSTIYNNSLAERLRIGAAGKVGIGNNNPQSFLDVTATDASSTSVSEVLALRHAANSASDGIGAGIGFYNTNATYGTFPESAHLESVITDMPNLHSAFVFSTLYNNSMAERMRIGAAGKVGIGTASPADMLDVVGGARSKSLTITNSTFPSDNATTNGQTMGQIWYGGTSSNAHTFFGNLYKVNRSFVMAHGVVLADTTVTNTSTATTNTVIYTVPMAANYLTVGKVLEPQLDGVIWQNSNVGTFPTLQAWINQTNLLLTIPLLNSTSITAGPWQANFRFTVRAIGNSAQLMGKCLEVQSSTSGGVSTSGLDSIVTPVTFDSTVNNTITITVSNSVAGGGGNCSVRLQEGRTVCIDSVPKLPGEL